MRYWFCFLFGLLFLTLPFSHVKVPFISLPLYLPELVILVAIPLFFLSRKEVEWRLPVQNKAVLIGAALFLCGAAVSFLANPFSWTGLGMLKAWFIFPMLGALLFFLSLRLSSEEKPYLFVWLGMTVGVACVAYFFLIHSLLTYDARLQATYTSPNFLAITLAPGILHSLYFFLTTFSPARYTYLAFISFLALPLFFTHSYAVWFALIFSVACMYVMNKEWRKKMSLTLLIIIFFVGTFLFLEKGTEKWDALLSLDDRSSFSSRIMIWNASQKILEDTLLVGIGVGRFQEVYLEYQKYFPPYLEWAVPQPHNLYLAILHQTGSVGFMGFILLLYSYFSHLGKFFSVSVEEKKRALATLFFSLMTLYLLYGFFDTPYFKTDLAFLFWLLLALGLGLRDDKRPLEGGL